MGTKRAYGSVAKEERRADILVVANRLFLSMESGLPTVMEIAKTAGLAKGTVYLYFGTKEEIFAELLREKWFEVSTELDRRITDVSDPLAGLKSFSVWLVSHMENHPELLRLDVLGPSVIEPKLSLEARAAYRNAILDMLLKTGANLDRALKLEQGRGFRILTRLYALIRGASLTFDTLTNADHECHSGRPLLKTELPEMLQEYLLGALSPVPE